jgi:hypothetical protein
VIYIPRNGIIVMRESGAGQITISRLHTAWPISDRVLHV